MLCIKKAMWMVLIPCAFSILAVIKHSVIMFLLFILIHFLMIKVTPAFKYNENIAMFVMVGFSSMPINIYILKILNDINIISSSYLLLNIFRFALYYIVLLSVEEVIMGVLTRSIWRKQYKVN